MPAHSSIHVPSKTSRPVDWHLGLTLALIGGLVFLGTLRLLLTPSQPSGPLDASLLILAVAASLTAWSKHLPMVNVLLAAGIAAGIGGAAHAVNDVTGFPFGKLTFHTSFGPRLLGILPVAMLGLWAVSTLVARGTARTVLRNWRHHPYHGFHVIGLSVVLMVIFQMALNSFGSSVTSWWSPIPTPIVNLLSTGAIGLLIQVIITPMLLDKFPGPRPPNFSPLAVWLTISGFFIAGLLLNKRLPEALLAGAVSGTMMALAMRSGNGTVTQPARTV